MAKHLVILGVLVLLLAQLGGCHYYINAVPQIIISSEPFDVTSGISNDGPQTALDVVP